MKRILAISLAIILTLSLLATAENTVTTEDDDIRVMLFGEELEFDTPPVIRNNRVLVPMRAIFEAFGMDVEWCGDTQTATVMSDRFWYVRLQIGNYLMSVRVGEDVELDVAPMIIDNRTFVPLRAIAETLNVSVHVPFVDWDECTQTVYIRSFPGFTRNHITIVDSIFSDRTGRIEEITTWEWGRIWNRTTSENLQSYDLRHGDVIVFSLNARAEIDRIAVNGSFDATAEISERITLPSGESVYMPFDDGRIVYTYREILDIQNGAIFVADIENPDSTVRILPRSYAYIYVFDPTSSEIRVGTMDDAEIGDWVFMFESFGSVMDFFIIK